MPLDGEPVIHVGFPKCASTFLQGEVFPQLKRYEFIMDANAQMELASSYHESPPDDHRLRQLGRTSYLYSNESVLSFTNFWASGGPWAHEREVSVANFIRLFRDHGSVLIVIRRQDALAESLLTSSAGRYDGRWDRVFVDFPSDIQVGALRLRSRWGRHTTDQLDYYTWVMRFAMALGKDRVHVLVFEDLVHDPERFYGALGTVVDEDLSRFIGTGTARNASPEQTVMLPSVFKPLLRLKGPAPKGLVQLGRRLFSKKLRFPPAQKASLLALYEEGNRKLSEEFGLDLQRYGYC